MIFYLLVLNFTAYTQDRTEVISTYALCGFANFGSVGIVIGVLVAMAPSRRSDIAQVALRAMLAGNIACFTTACIAGKLEKNGKIKQFSIIFPQ